MKSGGQRKDGRREQIREKARERIEAFKKATIAGFKCQSVPGPDNGTQLLLSFELQLSWALFVCTCGHGLCLKHGGSYKVF